MQLQLSQKDSEVNEGVRELHGRITLNTENMPDKQKVMFGFLMSEQKSTGIYDGLGVSCNVIAGKEGAKIHHFDLKTEAKPDLFSEEGHNIQKDDQNDWVIVQEESYVTCEDVGRCELSVAFIRNFDTMDPEHDIILNAEEEVEYAFTGFYEATNIVKKGRG